MDGALILLRAFRSAGLSLEGQATILRAIQDLRSVGIIAGPAGDPAHWVIPSQPEALHRRAEDLLPRDDDIPSRTVNLDTAPLRQLQTEAAVAIKSYPMLLQDILSDARIDQTQLWLRRGGSGAAEYLSASGERLHGPEPWQGNKRWNDLLQTVPIGGYMLGLIIWSDGVLSQSKTNTPMRVSIANFCSRERLKDGADRLLAILPDVRIRAPMGSAHHERLDPAQARDKAQILVDGAAHALAVVEADAREGEGSIVVSVQGLGDVPVHVRVLGYNADIKEQSAVLVFSNAHCPRCEGITVARRKEAAKAAEARKPYLRTDSDCFCGSAARRTPDRVTQQQVQFARESRLHGRKTAADNAAAEAGIRYDVQPQLNRLSTIYPWSCGGAYAAFQPDFLHVAQLGMYKVFCQMLDAYVCKDARERGLPTEDARHTIEAALRENVPPMQTPHSRLITFSVGWWSDALGSKISGADYTSFFSVLIFIYGCNSGLITNSTNRKKIVRLHQDMYAVHRKLTVPQWHSEAEVDELETRLKRIAKAFLWFQETLGSDCPGNGANRPKMHDFMAFGRVIREFGWPLNACTGSFERRNKALKAADRMTRRDVIHDAHSESLLNRANRIEGGAAGHRSGGGGGGGGGAHHHVSPQGTASVGGGLGWAKVLEGVEGGACGASSAGLSASIFACGGRSAVAYKSCVVRGTVIAPGHSVELADGRYMYVMCFHGGLAPGALLAALPFRSAARERHPLLHLRWLHRGAEIVHVPARDIKRRVHIVRLSGKEHGIRAASTTEEHFVVNSGCFHPADRTRPLRDVFMKCRSCPCGLVPCPTSGRLGDAAFCLNCSAVVAWV